MFALIWFGLCLCSTLWLAANNAEWYWIVINLALDVIAFKDAVVALLKR